ncbi:hypothetical protein, partial [uncultured Actinomyces sp.]|uniref:hypothetical protein n=1 Tax=uncultured Actinomyces sp. TaxID=249061 RepID=UPI00261D032E
LSVQNRFPDGLRGFVNKPPRLILAPVRVPQTFVRLLNAHPCQLHYVPREPQTFSTEETTISEPLVNTYWILIVDNFQ